MKFPIILPCLFPRLKFQLFDYSIISDDSIGENIISLAKTVGRLKKEGEIDIPKTWITMTHPENKD